MSFFGTIHVALSKDDKLKYILKKKGINFRKKKKYIIVIKKIDKFKYEISINNNKKYLDEDNFIINIYDDIILDIIVDTTGDTLIMHYNKNYKVIDDI